MKKSISTFLALVLIFLSSSLTFVKASPDSIKDNGTAIESPELNDTELENLDDFIEEQLINISGAGKYKGMVIWDNGTEKVYSITKNAEKIGWYVLDENGIISKYNQELDKELFNNMSIDEKITPELSELLDVEHDDLKHIYVWLKDIDTEKVYNQIPAIFSADNQQDISTIQTYINSQRTCYKEAYLKYNKDFLLSYFPDSNNEIISYSGIERNVIDSGEEKIEVISRYSPMCVLYTDADTINQMIKDDRVLEIGVYPEENWQDELSVATSSIQGTYVRDTKGYTGKGAVVGMIEATGVPDVSYSELKGANIIKRYSTTSSHATNVSTIIAGQSLGLAPKCTVYATYMTNSSSFIEEVEWLLDKGVSVINCSMRHGTTTGKYGIWDKWVDHIDMNHDVLFVKAAGNWDDEVGYVTSPGLAYNAITVGGYDDNNTAVSTDDTMWKYSSYNHANGTAEKPDIIAPAANFTFPGKSTSSGTSYSSPMVVGTVAQLLSAKPSLATQPGILKSVLLASAFRKISAGNYGSINYSPFFSNIEGAGKLDAKNALYVVNSGNYTYSYLSTDDFPYTKKFTASSSDNQARVALCWLKQCVINTGSHTDINNTVERTLSDLDLEVFDPNGNRVGYSMSYYNNVEIVEFNPAVTGTYTIKVKKNSGTTAKDFIYLAWW